LTVNDAPADGVLVLIAMPPPARTRNWFGPVETKGVKLKSDHTNDPSSPSASPEFATFAQPSP
jgi:hypothetical protein